MFHVVAVGAAVEHETVADNLYEFRVQFFGQSLACFLSRQSGSVEHRAFDELTLFDGFVRLLDGVFAQIVLADLDERIELGGQASQLLDLLLG